MLGDKKIESWDLVIIGGGPAGMIAAHTAATTLTSNGITDKRILLLERMGRVGTKLSITGRGRCNITNGKPHDEFIKHVHGDRMLAEHALQLYSSNDIIHFLNQHGLETVLERGTRYYPKSQKAKDVVDTLISAVEKAGVCVRCNCRVEALQTKELGWQMTIQTERDDPNTTQTIDAQNIILATGGMTYPKTGSTGDGYAILQKLGIPLVQPRPVLCGFHVQGRASDYSMGSKPLELRDIAVTIIDQDKPVANDLGEVDIRASLIGGAAILRLSRHVQDIREQGRIPHIQLDLRSGLSPSALQNRLLKLRDTRANEPAISALRALLPKGIILTICQKAHIKANARMASLTNQEIERTAKTIKALRFLVIDDEGWERSVITRGGLNGDQLNRETLELLPPHRGLYACGELLDIDADSGGYNLQLAYSTGFLAGKSAARQLLKKTPKTS